MSSDHRKPVPPGPGWACFHCGEVFVSQAEAEEHFGLWGVTLDGDWDPACVQVLNYSEKALRGALMDMQLELDAEREETRNLQDELEHLQGIEPQLERLFEGARTVHQAWLKLDFEKGRAMTAEAIIAAIAKTSPELVAAAREEICR